MDRLSKYILVLIFCLTIYSSLVHAIGGQCDGITDPIIDCTVPESSFCKTSQMCMIYHGSELWDSLTITPSTPTVIVNNWYAKFTVSGNYTFTVTKGSCVINTVVQISLPTYTVTQPKCFQSKFYITSSASYYDSSYQFMIGDNYFTTNATQEEVYYNPVANYYVTRPGPSGREACYVQFNLVPQYDVVPQLEFVKPICQQDNGKIIVTNYQQFSSLKLLMESSSANVTAVDGVFSNIWIQSGSSEEYALYATSDLCETTMRIYGVFYNYLPLLSVHSTPVSTTKCNNTYSNLTFLVTGLPTLGSPNVTVNGQNKTIGQSYIMENDEFVITYTGDACDLHMIYTPDASIPPVTYNSSPSHPTCSTNSTITFSSPNNNYTGLSVSSGIYGPETLNSNHQIQRGYGENITVQGQCGSFTILPTEPIFPQYHTEQDGEDCGSNMTVVIQNYNQFEFLELSGKFTFQDQQGRFIKIPLDFYTLTYREIGCAVNKTISLGYSVDNALYPYYLYWDVQVLVPSLFCNDTYTTLSIRPIYKGVVSLNATIVNITSSTPETFQVPFVHPQCPLAAPPFFTSTPYKQITSPKITLASLPKCKSSWPMVKIETESPYINVTVPTFGAIPKKSDGLYPVDPTNLNININYEGCSVSYDLLYLFTEISQSQPDAEVDYTVIPQSNTDCSTPSGGIKINPSNFTFAQVNQANSPNGEWTGYGSLETQRLVYIHDFCGYGYVDVDITTSEEGIVISEHTNPAMCLGTSGDGSIYINVTRNGAKYHYDNIDADIGQYNNNTGLVKGMLAGDRTLSIYTGDYCVFRRNVFIPVKISGHAFKATILKYPQNSIQKGLIRIDPLYSGLTVDFVAVLSGTVSTDFKYIFGVNPNRDDLEDFIIQIQYNIFCRDFIHLNFTDPTPHVPRFTVAPVKQCGTTLATIQFEQETLNKFYVFIYEYGAVVNTNPITVRGDNNIRYSYQDKETLELNVDSYYIDFNFDYPVNPVITYTNESCSGMVDGSITVSGIDFTKNIVTLAYTPASSRMIGSNTMVFEYLKSTDYRVLVQSTSNQFCASSYDVTISPNDPEIYVNPNPICFDDNDIHSAIQGSITVSSNQLSYNLSVAVNNANILGTIFSTTQSGDYAVTVNATKGTCFASTVHFVNIIVSSLRISNAYSFGCGEITASVGFQYQIYNSKGELVRDVLPEGVTLYTGLPSDTYKVVVADSTCVKDSYVVVKGCESPSTISTATYTSPSLIFLLILSLLLILYI